MGCIVAGILTFINYSRRRYVLILTPEGFYNHSTVLDHGNHLILWSVIGDITADRQGKEIRAVIADTHAYNWTLTGIRALTRVTHEGAANSTITISTMAMKLPEGMSIEDLAAVMRDYRDRASNQPTVEGPENQEADTERKVGKNYHSGRVRSASTTCPARVFCSAT